jgi:hypothetical protein
MTRDGPPISFLLGKGVSRFLYAYRKVLAIKLVILHISPKPSTVYRVYIVFLTYNLTRSVHSYTYYLG